VQFHIIVNTHTHIPKEGIGVLEDRNTKLLKLQLPEEWGVLGKKCLWWGRYMYRTRTSKLLVSLRA